MDVKRNKGATTQGYDITSQALITAKRNITLWCQAEKSPYLCMIPKNTKIPLCTSASYSVITEE